MTTQTSEQLLETVAQAMKELGKLTDALAKHVALEKATQPSPRRKVINAARRDVETLEKAYAHTQVKYYIDEKRGIVVARIIGEFTGKELGKGIARLSKDDKFDAYIGKAIAIHRALKLAVPQDYLNAPQK